MSTLWGIDLGGTKIEGVVLETSSGLNALARPRIGTEADLGYDHIVTRVAGLLTLMESETGLPLPGKIGIGTPGAVVPSTGLMKNCNTTCLNGRPLLDDLARALGVEVVMANDADCFALAEATLGAGMGYRTVFGVIMGTGVGGGIAIGGKLLRGPNGLTGEWGHMTLDPTGTECYCGRRGCVETYLSGPAVERSYQSRTGVAVNLRAIVAEAPHDLECGRTISEMCERFGQAIAQVVNLLDPDVIVLGGGAGQVPQLKTEGMLRARDHVFGPDFVTQALAPVLGDSAGVFGAAMLTGSKKD